MALKASSSKISTKIVAIGGGDLRKKSTRVIDQEIVKLTGKKSPNFLFIPTASSDNERYWDVMNAYYSQDFGCKTDVLYLLKENPTSEQIKKKISWADIIYVGGGNTLKMMRRWRTLGVDKLLKQAWKNGKVMCGVSAGAICWFGGGHSDSMSFYNKENWKYVKVRGLSLVEGIYCPHYDGKTLNIPRRKNYHTMIKKLREKNTHNQNHFGLTTDNNAAFEFIDNSYRILSSKSTANAYKVYKKKGKIIEEIIPKTKEFRPLKNLYKI